MAGHTDLIQRLRDEGDLCSNEGASDIAALLDEAVNALEAPPPITQDKALKADADRYHWLRDWLAFEGLLWCHFCKPPDAPVGNYWVLRKPAMVNGSSCEGYGKTEEEAIDAAIAERAAKRGQ